jgi:hypothetical protein
MPNNLAGTRGSLKQLNALRELANLRDEPASFERFANRWPALTHILDEDPLDTIRIKYVGFSYGEPPTKMPRSLPKRFLLMWQAREALREIWRGNSQKLTEVLLPSLDDIFADPDPEGLWPPQLRVDWQRGEFVFVPRSEFQGAVYELFRRSPRVNMCENPDCPAPYYIPSKAVQRYCSDGCAQVFQREWKRRWWKEQGSAWRRKKSREK